MPMTPRYSMAEFARRGDALYDSEVAPRLAPEDDGKVVAIDIETGFFELGENDLEAVDRLRTRVADPQVWLTRAGSRVLRHFGGHGLP